MSTPSSRALQRAADYDDPARVAALDAELARREAAVNTLRVELHDLQTRYLREIGGFYAELGRLDAAIVEIEIARGLRVPAPPIDEAPDADGPGTGGADAVACSSRSAPSDDLKRVFRDLAKTIHPDLAPDDPARWRRHSLMAEANRAYAERDEDRLRLIMHAWETDADVAFGEAGPRSVAALERRLARVDRDLADLHASAIWRLKHRIEDARRQGWDLFAEMILQVTSEIARARARLASLQRAS